MNNSLVIKSFISNYSHEEGDYYTFKEENYLEVTDPFAIEAAKACLNENNQDYLRGYVFLKFNDKVILSEKMETEDMLYTWLNFSEIIRKNQEDKEYKITFLDNAIGDALIRKKNENFEFAFEYEKNKELVVMPKDELINELKTNYLEFIKFCKNPSLDFSNESLYNSIIEDQNSFK
ncbi:hypothetical protein [Cytobacillus horneckiae]|uniref:hypothetical protein n=1 Tax=Cytobacillus horneckiae TaxID=549687 RepID=UPI002040C6BF|nr:hypothetical protein [Cytobacillus horneckiae]MCM3178557.1 hypothetical protein [Cytobacillus horneckiae]